VSQNDEIPEDLEFQSDRDIVGFLPHRDWSCMTLDAADKLAPMLGKEGMELYYHMAQLIEAYQVKFEGQGEAELKAYGDEEYKEVGKTEMRESLHGMPAEFEPAIRKQTREYKERRLKAYRDAVEKLQRERADIVAEESRAVAPLERRKDEAYAALEACMAGPPGGYFNI